MGRMRSQNTRESKKTGRLRGILRFGLISMILWGSTLQLAWSLGTEFTYQGRLLEEETPANGDYGLWFKLYDAATGGSTVASDITTTVTVTDGLFSVGLDFGAGAFNGERRWLEIGVRKSGDSVYDFSETRQEVTPAPYAMNADMVDGLHASATPTANKLLALDANAKIPDAALPASATDHHSLDAADGDPADAVIVDENGKVGIRNPSPAGQLDVVGDGSEGVPMAIKASVTANGYDNYGVYASLSDLGGADTGTAVYGYTSGAMGNFGVQGIASGNANAENTGMKGQATGTNTSNIGVYGYTYGSGSTNYGVYGNASGGTTNYAGYFPVGDMYMGGNVGMGSTPSPSYRLYVNGNGYLNGTNYLTGNTYIGSSSTDADDLYIADRLVDWDNTAYYLDPNGTSVLNKIDFGTGYIDWDGQYLRIGHENGPVYIDTGTANGYWYSDNLYLGSTSGDVIHFRDNVVKGRYLQAEGSNGLNLRTDDGATRLLVADSGNIGIGTGTDSPASILHILKYNDEQIRLDGTNPGDTSHVIASSFLCAESGTSDKPSLAIAVNGQFDSGAWKHISSVSTPAWALVEDTNVDQFSVSRSSARTGGNAAYWSALLTLSNNGILSLLSSGTSSPSCGAGRGNLYAKSVWEISNLYTEVFAQDELDNETRLSSHANPNALVPDAQSSFAETDQVALPWSFQHSNRLIGKGAIVDVAKAMKWVEEQMQKEQGEKAGRIFYDYDLPKSDKLAIDDYYTNAVMSDIGKRLKADPFVECALGADGQVPPEALEQVDAMETVEVEEDVVVHRFDGKSGRIVAVTETRKVGQERPTGEKIYRLKKGYHVSEDGKLFRQRTMDDLDADEIARKLPSLPDWILNRIPDGRKAAAEWTTSSARVKQAIANAEKKQAAQKSDTGLAKAGPPEKSLPLQSSDASPETTGPSRVNVADRLPGGGG